MKLLHTVLELDKWIYSKLPCSFCTSLKEEDKIVCQIRTRSEVSHKIVENSVACQNCKEKFERGELPKCEKCDRLKTDSNVDIFSGKYVCDCEEEDEQEKELPVLPGEEREATFYERQINALREEKNQLTEEVDTHLEALEVSEVWNKKQKEELVEEIDKLKEKNKKLEEENKKLLTEELGKKVELYEKEIDGLKKQLEHFQQQTAQIETPPKDKGIKSLFKFGGKK